MRSNKKVIHVWIDNSKIGKAVSDVKLIDYLTHNDLLLLSSNEYYVDIRLNDYRVDSTINTPSNRENPLYIHNEKLLYTEFTDKMCYYDCGFFSIDILDLIIEFINARGILKIILILTEKNKNHE